MRKILIFLVLLQALVLAAQTADTLRFPLPQLMNPFYESFSRNYYSTVAMGRGYTGVAIPGGIDNVLLNPAAYVPDKASLHIEGIVKPPVEYTPYIKAPGDTAYVEQNDRLWSSVPFGVMGFGGKIWGDFTGALLYSAPRSVKLDDFSIEMNFNDVQTPIGFPTYIEHQFTANAGWHKGNLNAGLNLNAQLHYLGDVPYIRTFENLRFNKFLLSPQLGFAYVGKDFNAGISLTPPMKINWDLKYATYNATLPMNAVAGVAYKANNSTLTAELDWKNTHSLDPLYKDTYNVHLGWEINVHRFNYRLGYVFHPQVFSGYYLLPQNTSPSADSASIWWDYMTPYGYVAQNNQHLLSIGSTWLHQDVHVNIGAIIDVGGQTPVAEVSASVDLFFSAFKSKKFLYFD
jgi:hypothetical protein